MRVLFSLGLFLLFDLYVFQAFALVAAGWSAPTQMLWYGLFWLIPILALVFILGGGWPRQFQTNKRLFTILRAIIFIAYFSKFIMAGTLLLDDVRRMGLSLYESVAGYQQFELNRSTFNAQLALFLGGIPFFLLTYGLIRNPYRYKVFREKIPIKDLPEALEGLKIVQISDIHSGSFTQREPVREAVRLINEQRPDLVFFTGDLVNASASEMIPFIDVFDKIKAVHGVYSILGNHDYGDYYAWENPEAKRQNFQNLLQTHGRLGWDLMLNENRLLEINGEKIAVIGVENYSASSRFQKYGDLSKAYSGTEGASLKLLLSHDPSHWGCRGDQSLQRYRRYLLRAYPRIPVRDRDSRLAEVESDQIRLPQMGRALSRRTAIPLRQPRIGLFGLSRQSGNPSGNYSD